MRNLLTIWFLTSCIWASAQKIIPHWVPENIDSLKSVLFSARDTTRINLLNELSFAYFYIQSDSARIYAQQAYREAVIKGYGKGLAISLFYSGQLESLLDSSKQAREYAAKSLESAKTCADKKTIATTAAFLGVLSPLDKGLPLVDQADSISESIGDIQGRLDAIAARGILYIRAGQTYDALHAFNQYSLLAKQSWDAEYSANGLHQIGRIYSIIGDYKTSNELLRQAVLVRQINRLTSFKGYDEITYNYIQLKKYDSALYFINRHLAQINFFIKDSAIKEKLLPRGLMNKGEVYVKLREYDTALSLLLPGLADIQLKNTGFLMYTISLIGEAYNGKGNYDKALAYGRSLMQMALSNRLVTSQKGAAGILAAAYEGLKMKDSALFYLKIFTALNDSLATRNSDKNMTFYKTLNLNEAAQGKIQLLDKNNHIKQQQVNMLIAGLAIFLLFGFFVIRFINLKRKNEIHRRSLLEKELQIQKLESETKHAFFQQQAAELEMQALRAQMNPHFIFNCLNAINHFVLKNETEMASDYLTKFSRLIRMVLQNSSKKNISLEDELTTLRLYIDLEQLRFKNRFQFAISVDSRLDPESIMIPSLLIQPFVENAIWHGLMNKESEGRLEIEVTEENKLLQCTITDNGIGRESSAVATLLTPVKKSMGMQITAHRLKLLDKGGAGIFTITDLKDEKGHACGTKVMVTIPVDISETIDG